MTKHPSRKVMNFRHLLGCDAIAFSGSLSGGELKSHNKAMEDMQRAQIEWAKKDKIL